MPNVPSLPADHYLLHRWHTVGAGNRSRFMFSQFGCVKCWSPAQFGRLMHKCHTGELFLWTHGLMEDDWYTPSAPRRLSNAKMDICCKLPPGKKPRFANNFATPRFWHCCVRVSLGHQLPQTSVFWCIIWFFWAKEWRENAAESLSKRWWIHVDTLFQYVSFGQTELVSGALKVGLALVQLDSILRTCRNAR